MSEKIMPIPGDAKGNNARRFLEFQSELLLANGVSVRTIKRAGLNPQDADAVDEQNAAFKEAQRSRSDHQFIGWFEKVDTSLKLEGGMKLQLVDMLNLARYFRPIDTFAVGYTATREYPLEKFMGISALAAEGSNNQPVILEELLEVAMSTDLNASARTYITLPPIDPAHEIVKAAGFEDAGGITVRKKNGIPYTLFVRDTQQNT